MCGALSETGSAYADVRVGDVEEETSIESARFFVGVWWDIENVERDIRIGAWDIRIQGLFIRRACAFYRDKVPDISRQLTFFGKQLPVISKQLLFISNQLPDISRQLTFFGKQLPDISRQLTFFGKQAPDISRAVDFYQCKAI
ncbi:hypothetical protein KM885_04095 [Oceanobacillus caeni]|uniref:hypothetical protein n=1 Tax=Oceanobacillus caeni TaxID=405946 RepID=UPI001C22074D|nr:hypothetical protein [Oceanobacillus caeni]MBU8789967.1 hypothetical protein [Oceanobacillus caeni]